MDYRDPQMDRSASAEPSYAEGWAASRIVPLPLDPRIEAVLDACEWWKSFAGQFLLELAPPVDLCVRRNLPDETSFFRDFLTHPALLDQLPNHEPLGFPPWEGGPLPHDMGLRRNGSWVTTAALAGAVAFRGITAHSSNPDDKVLRLIRDFAEAAFESRYSGTWGYSSAEPWCDWFLGAVSDGTYFWLDKKRGIATVILTSDSD